MGVYIKGMEMPTDHPLWIIVHSDGTVEANEVSASRPVGWQTLRNAAVPVPPHGRLIDRDALDIYRREEQAWHDYKLNPDNEYLEGVKDGLHEAAKQLSTAPTVIPADKEGRE